MNKTINNVTLRGEAVDILGDFPQIGTVLTGLQFTNADLAEVSLDNYANKKKIINIFPSIDRPVCAMSVRTFNEQAAALTDTVVLNVSVDLPFAQARFCGAQGIEGVENLSLFRNDAVREALGVAINSTAYKGLCARAVLVLDTNNTVLYAQRVAEIADEPDYESALAVL